MQKSLKHLSFSSLSHCLTLIFRDIPDRRQKSKVIHSMHDAVMSAFGVMHFQDPSLLESQRRLQRDNDRNNLKTLLGVETIPEDTQMREILDDIDREEFRPAFKNFTHRLQRGKHLEQYRLFDESYLAVIDGTEYFSSKTVHCDRCLTKKHKDGTVTYSHQALQGAIVYPGLRQVIPLMPEEIHNSDGTEKQDCEINAGKRFISKLRRDHPHLKITIGGDGINSKQPMIELIRQEGMNHILVAKPDDHKFMMEWVAEQKQLGEVKTKRVTDEKGRTHVYEWINQVPLHGQPDSIEVNFFQYRMIVTENNGERNVHYKNSWVTDFEISSQNVESLVLAGRCRWKIENECFNTLKNQGYHLDHNFGHGKKNLSCIFYLLILLAFFCHQIYELTDDLFQQCRKEWKKTTLWERVRAALGWFVFETWEMLLHFILDPESFQPTIIKPG